jgi:hypothetical protein
MFNNVIFSDSSTLLELTGKIEKGNIHSNDSISTSPLINFNSVTYSSVSLGDSPVLFLDFDTVGYYNEAVSQSHYINSDTGFYSGINYTGNWYINGDVTIGGAEWWNKNYKRRIRLEIINNNIDNVPLTTGYSINIDLDTNSLISAGLVQPDLSDLRVVKYDPITRTSTEIDRVYVHRPDLKGLWFAITQNIWSGDISRDYYIYYNNPSAANPPANFDNVFLVYDTFAINSLGNYNNGRHLDLHGGGTSFMNYDAVNQRLIFNTGDNRDAGIRTGGLNEQSVVVQVDIGVDAVYPTNGSFAIATKYQNKNNNVLAHISNGDYVSPGIGTDGTMNTDIVDPAGNFYFPADGSTHTLKFASGEIGRWWVWSWTNYYFWVDGVLRAEFTWSDIKSWNTGQVVVEAAQQQGWIDNLVVRKIIYPEPSVNIIQEGNTEIQGTICATGDIILVGTLKLKIDNIGDTYPSLITKSSIYFNGTKNSGSEMPDLIGLIYAGDTVDIDNIKLRGSIYAGKVITRNNVDITYEDNADKDPYINPPPYFNNTTGGFIPLIWMDE